MNLISIKQGCDILCVSRTKLYELIRTGQIRIVKIGKRGIRIPISEMERFVQSQLDRPLWGDCHD